MQRVGVGQQRQQALLVCDVAHDDLVAKLGALARVADGVEQPDLERVNTALGNQDTACACVQKQTEVGRE